MTPEIRPVRGHFYCSVDTQREAEDEIRKYMN